MGYIYNIPLEYELYVNYVFLLGLYDRLFDIYGESLFRPLGHEYNLCSGSKGWILAFNNTCDALGYTEFKEYRSSLNWQEIEKFDDQIESELIKFYVERNQKNG